MIRNIALQYFSTGTDNHEFVPPAEADNILPPMPLYEEEKKIFLGMLSTNYMIQCSMDLVY